MMIIKVSVVQGAIARFLIYLCDMSMQTWISILTNLFPVISALTCCLLMLLTYKDSVQEEERYLKRGLFFFYFSVAFGWACVIVYTWLPRLFVYLNSLCYCSFIMMSVTFYHVVFWLTRVDSSEHFSTWHYGLPVLIPFALLVWSLFVPLDVQVAIVAVDSPLEDVYFYFTRFFTSQLMVAFLFCLCYTLLGLKRLFRYWHVTRERSGDMGEPPLRWLGSVLLLFLVSLCMPLLEPLFAESYWVDFLPIGILLLQFSIISYNVIVGNYVLCPCERGASGDRLVIKKPPLLNKERFEKYMREEKPYLNPELKITTLTGGLQTNRTYLSTFINRTYGMNFNAYINDCRLREMESLLADSTYAGECMTELAIRAGFGCYHSYRRAKKRNITNF